MNLLHSPFSQLGAINENGLAHHFDAMAVIQMTNPGGVFCEMAYSVTTVN